MTQTQDETQLHSLFTTSLPLGIGTSAIQEQSLNP